MRRRFKSSIDIARNRGLEKQSDMRRAKRVRFDDTEMNGSPVRASSTRREATQSPKCGAHKAKTSEYAYFRKVKNGVRGHSRELHKENEEFNSSKVNCLVRETSSASNKLKLSTKDLNFSVSGETAGPSDIKLFLSPRVSKCDEPDQIRYKELTNKTKKRSFLLSENVTPVGQSPFSSPLNVASANSENQYSEKGIFSVKRHRLCQWVAHNAFLEVEKHHPKGFDLVSLLLQRLFPKGNENNDSLNGDADNSTKSLKFHESSNLEKGLNLSHKRDWEKDLPKICSGRSSDIVLAGWDSFVPGFASNYLNESHLQDESTDPDQHSMSCTYRSSHTRHGFSFCLPFESYRSSGSFHFKDVDEFGSIIEHGREPYKLLLEWDSELGEDRVNSSIVNHNIEKNVHARLANSWNVDQQRIVDNVLDTKGLCPSSLLFNALPSSSSSGWLMHDFGPSFDATKCAMAEPGQFSLAVPYTPKCVTLAEDRNGESILSKSDIFS